MAASGIASAVPLKDVNIQDIQLAQIRKLGARVRVTVGIVQARGRPVVETIRKQ